jgi:hypothetical protein
MVPADMVQTRDQNAPVVVIVEHLRLGGAAELRAAATRGWIVGRAPSGALFELYWWPGHGYAVTLRPSDNQPMQHLGLFPWWTEAVRCVLHV